MRVSSHQPSLLPWAGYWHKVWSSDLHVMSAGVAFDKAGYQNRVMYEGHWLTLPVAKPVDGVPINQIKLPENGVRDLLATFHGRTKKCGSPIRKQRLKHLAMVMEGQRTATSLLSVQLALYCAIQCLLCPEAVTDFRVAQHGGVGLSKTDRLMSRVRPHARGQFEYLAGGGASYLVLDEMPGCTQILRQKIVKPVPAGSILDWIVAYDDPYKEIMDSFAWGD